MTVDDVERKISQLRRKRGTLKAKLTCLRRFVDNYNESPDLNQLASRKEQFATDRATFDSVQSELELLVSDENVDTELAEREEYEGTAFQYESKINSLLNTNFVQPIQIVDHVATANPTSQAVLPLETPHESHVKLPTMRLPLFEGKESESWSSFSASFRSAVHENPAYSAAQKLVYLRTCLKGRALEKIESLEIVDANYKIAWDTLEDAYFDFNTVVEKLIQSFSNLPQCKKQCSFELSNLVDEASKNFRALEALKKPYLHMFPMQAIITKLDEQTRLKWKETALTIENPQVDHLLNFLNNRRKILSELKPKESKVESNNLNNGSKREQFKFNKNHTQLSHPCSTQVKPAFCHLCKEPHYTYTCGKLLNASPNDRYNIVKTANLCLNCLRSNHSVKDCKMSSRCKTCNASHHSLLHFDSPNVKSNNEKTTTGMTAIVEPHVILSTAVVHLIDKHGYPQAGRALLDSGAQSNFITQTFADKLGLVQQPVEIFVVGVNQVRTKIRGSIKIKLQSRINGFSSELSFLVLPRITEKLPSSQLPKSSFNLPKNHPLADPEFYKSSDIDLLIGAEIFYKLLCVGQVELTSSSLILQKTLLGWVVSGKSSSYNKPKVVACNIALDTLNQKIERFWELEECPNKRPISKEGEACELHFEKTIVRNPNTGRYTVRLPFNEKRGQLGESYSIALKRFLSLEKRLASNPEQREQYHEFLTEYKNLNHMSENENDDNLGVYLPHHAVVKQSSLTTKTRVVFDASAKSSTGVSLNDALMVGPTIQEDLFSILLRFRVHVYVLTADIEKMYRQIEVHPDDREYQKILFRFSPLDPIKTYKLNTVTYGTSSAPFLATRVLKQLARDEMLTHPLGSSVLENDFYVDDLLTGAKTMSEAENIRDEVISIIKRGGMNLRKFASNEPTLIDKLDNNPGDPLLCLNSTDTVKTLGVLWNASLDSIEYRLDLKVSDTRVTKRSILSHIASLFDPLGLLGPVIVKGKLIMQDLWKLQLDWDESVPIEVQTSWLAFQSQLDLIHSISFSRRVVVPDYVSLQLHGFCDASEKAYGCAIYIRSTAPDGTAEVHLLCSKSRVAPLKTISIPRLELCASLLLAKLSNLVMQSLSRFSLEKVQLWSDSTIALHWIKAQPHELKTFVGNRVSEIQKLTSNCEWSHVKSEDNPADIVSRGATFSELSSRQEFWANGPSWLKLSSDSWPIVPLDKIVVPEKKPVIITNCLVNAKIPEPFILERFSSFSKLRRVVAYCLRFVQLCRSKSRTNPIIYEGDAHEKNNPLTTGELKESTTKIFKVVQSVAYSSELKLLKQERPVTGHISSLSPFLDKDGLIRVGSRLKHSELPYTQKYPILIPSDCHVTSLIIKHEHMKNLHAPAHATLCALRQYVWIVDGRNSVNRELRSCIPCFRAKPIAPTCIMGNLPKGRTVFSRPFLEAGVDLGGPFFIKEKRHRNRNKIKVYLAVFVCFSIRAVHIEIVEDLTTEAFIAALKRFCSRRGKPRIIHSDNATNFAGSKREIDEINQFLNSRRTRRELMTITANEGITWKFIPPRSPHFGGLWEAAIKSMKRLLTRCAGTTLLSYEALHTLSVEIEGVLNSRPLTPFSSDPNDFQTLTPAHFLIGDSIKTLPEYDFRDTPTNKLSLWQHVQKMKQHFWMRWRHEYLNELHIRTKWRTGSSKHLKVGQAVILHDDNLPVNQWKLARITAIHPDEEGNVRVVTIKTASGEYNRTIKKISPLPIDHEI